MPRILRWAVIVVVAAGLLTAGGYYFVLHTLKSQVIRLLGDHSEYATLQVSLKTIVIEGLSIHDDPEVDGIDGWPTKDELRAERVVIEPDLRSLLSKDILISRLRFEKADLPIMRVGGRLRFLPTLLETRRRARIAKGEEGGPPKKYVHIAHVDLVDSKIDFYDATIASKPYRISLTDINGSIEKLKMPTLDEAATLDLKGVTKANGHRGTIALRGTLVPHTRDSRLDLQLRGVDLQLLQPYFVKRTRTQVETGTMDVDLTSTVRDHVLNAPGKMVLHNLKMGGGFEFGSLSRQITLGILKDDHDRIDLQFTLAGNLNDPKFSLNEELYMRVGAGLARALGMSIEGLGKGALSVGEGIGSVLRGIVE